MSLSNFFYIFRDNVKERNDNDDYMGDIAPNVAITWGTFAPI